MQSGIIEKHSVPLNKILVAALGTSVRCITPQSPHGARSRGRDGSPTREMTLLVTHFGTSRRVVDTLNTLNIIRKVAAAMRPLTTRQVAIHLLLLKRIA